MLLVVYLRIFSYPRDFSPVLSSRCCVVLGFTFRSMVHFVLIFSMVQGIGWVCLSSSHLPSLCPFFPSLWIPSHFSPICLKEYSCSIELRLYLFLESIDHTCVGLFLDSLFCSITRSLSFRQYHTVLISVAFSKLCNQVARALQFCSVSNLATLLFNTHFKITCHFLTTTA